MSNHFSELESTWKQDKKNIQSTSVNLEDVYEKIRAHKKESFLFHYGTITILGLTFIGISCFFYFVAPVENILSRVGVTFMIGGLALRIFIETISIGKARRIDVVDSSIRAVNNAKAFYQYRKRIHEVIAPIIILFYTVGFYIITPEFLVYLPVWNVVVFDISYLLIAVFLFFQIRKGVRKEMKNVREIVALQNDLTN